MSLAVGSLVLALALAGTTPLPAALPETAPAKAAAPDPWAPLRFLAGEWTATGGGAPGEAEGSFSFAWDLEGKILVRRNRAVYPPRGGETKPATHEDLMVVYLVEGKPAAIYFDAEGHVIEYAVTTGDGSVTLESAAAPGAPRFRLVYEKKDAATVTVTFAIAPPGGAYKTYVSGVGRRR